MSAVPSSDGRDLGVPPSSAVSASPPTGPCPQCGSTALARVRTDPVWCTHCEWNLGQWPAPVEKKGRRATLRNRRRAFAANRRLLGELEGVRPQPLRRSRAGVVLAAASLALVLVDLALIATGLYLIVTAIWTVKIVAVILVMIGIECRIRFYRLDSYGSVTRDEAPQLWSVVDRAAASLGAPAVDRLTITNEFNAACGRSGLRRQTVLEIGLPLWAALGPAGRQALLGHELGHLVNGDPTTAFATQPALTTFRRLAQIFDPDGLVDSSNPVRELIGTVIAYLVFYPFQSGCRAAHRFLSRVAAQDHQRAEAYADALALRLGGTAGAVELMRVMLFGDAVRAALRRAAPSGAEPDAWRAEVERALAQRQPDTRLAEQRSMRYDVELYASHPPSGLRSRLVRSWPATEPAVPVLADTFLAADAELTGKYASARRAIVNGSVR